MINNRIIQKYLSKQDLHNWNIELFNNKLFSNIIVIPAIDEYDNLKKLVNSLSTNNLDEINKTLALFVINNKASDSAEIKNNNLKSIKFIKSLPSEKDSKLKFAFVDCTSEGKELPEKDGGVGLARKIGMDLALSKFDFESENTNIIISLDADCLVSENYIEAINNKFSEPKVKAAVINFEHQLSENIEQNFAIINYETFLRYYLLGLKIAKSPFAFHTIGSTFAVEAETYAKIGGMNKRKAGEDFYFLQKLAKNVEIHKVVNATVFPSSRVSNRVPFGTGPRINRFLENSQNEYFVYSPKSFLVLKDWLVVLNKSTISKSPTFQKSWAFVNSKELLHKAKSINNELYNFLISQNFDENWANILNNSKSEKQLNQNIKNWMDGFRTLKLIHHLRDNDFPNENMFESINALFSKIDEKPIKINSSQIPNLETQTEFLTELRHLTLNH